jgi:hypothetical protein
MEKVIRDGKVAVLISTGFGAGWYCWNKECQSLLFHPKLVEMVEKNKQSEIDEDWIKDNLGIENVYCGGADDLEIRWLCINTKFIVEDYDGCEYIITENDF